MGRIKLMLVALAAMVTIRKNPPILRKAAYAGFRLVGLGVLPLGFEVEGVAVREYPSFGHSGFSFSVARASGELRTSRGGRMDQRAAASRPAGLPALARRAAH